MMSEISPTTADSSSDMLPEGEPQKEPLFAVGDEKEMPQIFSVIAEAIC